MRKGGDGSDREINQWETTVQPFNCSTVPLPAPPQPPTPISQHICCDCKKSFCAPCSVLQENLRCCSTCHLLRSTAFQRPRLMRLRVKELRQYLLLRNIPTDTCREKQDLVDLVICHQGAADTPGPLDEEEEEEEDDDDDEEEEAEVLEALEDGEVQELEEEREEVL